MCRDLRAPALSLALSLAMLASAGPALAASFDCTKASAPVERAICADAGLSAADEGIALLYRHLLSPACRATPGVDGLVDDQRAWLAATRQAFRPGDEGVQALASAYAARQRQLDPLVDACGAKRTSTPPLKIESIDAPGNVLPFASGVSPEIGWRINQTVFTEFIDVAAPARRDAARATLVAATRPVEGRITRTSDLAFTVRRNDGRLLVLEVSGEGCGAYCESFTRQLMFDARTGHLVPVADLFTREGTRTLARRVFEHRVREGRAIVAKARRANELDRDSDEEGTYRQCLREWTEWARETPFLSPLWLTEKGRWQVQVGSCSVHANRPHSLLDELHLPVTLAELRPLMSAFGRSLLLGEGDVRSPVAAVARCEGPTLAQRLVPPTDPGPRFAADEDTAAWLLADGRAVIWQHGFAAAAEAVTATPGRADDRYVALARGQGFFAGLRADGSLWTWGSNDRGRLGLAGRNAADTPQFLLDQVAQVALGAYSGLAVRRDGTLWLWGAALRAGDGPAPRRVLDDVVQAVWGHRDEVLALRRDGSVWGIGGQPPSGGPRPPLSPRRIGDGYVRLAGPQVEAAWRADGTLWAWEDTLVSLTGTSDAPLPPAAVGADVVQVIGPSGGWPTLLLKTDGSVWAPGGWGGQYAPRRVACGVRALATAPGPTVLGLTHDDRLIAWSATGSSGSREAAGDFLARAPLELGRGFTAMWRSDPVWGSIDGLTLVQRGADDLWVTRTPPRSGEKPPPRQGLLQPLRLAP